MRDQIEEGDFNGQQGTLKMDYDFNYFDLNMKFEKFILPRKSERVSRHPSHDDRMRTAMGLQIETFRESTLQETGEFWTGHGTEDGAEKGSGWTLTNIA